MKIDLEPLTTRVIIIPNELPEKSEGGIILVKPSLSEFVPTEGKVIACGPDCTQVKVGDYVYYGKYSGFRFTRKVDGVDTLCVGMNEEDILFKIIKEEN